MGVKFFFFYYLNLNYHFAIKASYIFVSAGFTKDSFQQKQRSFQN